MKYIIATIIGLSLIAGVAYAANDARFDFTNGQPTVMENPTSATSNCATRYDFTNGQPSFVYDATASCPVVASGSLTKDDLWIME